MVPSYDPWRSPLLGGLIIQGPYRLHCMCFFFLIGWRFTACMDARRLYVYCMSHVYVHIAYKAASSKRVIKV